MASVVPLFEPVVKIVDELPLNDRPNWIVAYVVYRNSTDYPGLVVVRRQTLGRGVILVEREPLLVTDNLADARRAIPPGLVCLRRSPTDEPQIVETWL
jgi:hypothetical protein